MAIDPVKLKLKPKGGGGGLFAKIAGGIVGALGTAAAPFTGGSSAAGGLAAGAAIAGTGAGIASQFLGPKARKFGGVPILKSAEKLNPEVQLAQLVSTEKKINESGQLDENQRRVALDPVQKAQAALKERIRVR